MTLELDLKNISIKLPGKWIMALESLVECGLFNNRSEAIREAIRDLFSKYKPIIRTVTSEFSEILEYEFKDVEERITKREMRWDYVLRLIQMGYTVIFKKGFVQIKKDGETIEIRMNENRNYEILVNGQRLCKRWTKTMAFKRVMEYVIWKR